MAGMHVAPVGSGVAWGGTGLQIRSHLGGTSSIAPPTVPGWVPPTRQTANMSGGLSPRGCGRKRGGPEGATHLQVSPAMKSKMAPMSSLFQKSLKYRNATFVSPNSSGS